MKLAVEVEQDGGPVPVEVDTELANSVDTYRVITLVGYGPLRRLAAGEWDPDAAKGIIYVNLMRALSDGDPDWDNLPFDFSEMDLDWGEMTPHMEPDPEMESALADLSEEVSE